MRNKNVITGLLIMSTSVILFLISVNSVFYNKILTLRPVNEQIVTPNTSRHLNENLNENSSFSYKLLVMADRHSNEEINFELKKIVDIENPDLIIHLGDHTDFGDIKSLTNSKKFLDSLGKPYVALPGDRDLAETSSEANFYKVFDRVTNVSIKEDNFVFLDNSFNFTPIPDEAFRTYLSQIPNSKIIFLSQPLLVEKGNIFENKYMGSETAFSNLSNRQKENMKFYKIQRDLILKEVKDRGIDLVVSGDHHRSLTFTEKGYSNSTFHIVGALSKSISTGSYEIKQESLQSRRISIIEKIGDDFKIREIEIK